MAKYSNVVEYNIVTDVDSSGIVKLQNELTKLKQSLKFDKAGFNQLGFDDAKIEKSIQKVNQLQKAITAAFNPKIGTLDLSRLNASLQKEHTNLQMIVKDWAQMGTRGTMAISNLSNALLSMNKGALNVNTTLSKIANTFSNTVRWGITASIFQEMMSSVQGAVSYMKDLDESLTQIQMVTNSSKENMRELAQYANNAAQALGSTTVDYTNAVKVFVQEGFSETESKQYANLSTKLANVSEQSTAVTSDQITAFRNAFQLDYEQTVAAMDKVANVANNTASNVNELMTASQRAASVAQAVGSSQESFLAAIATIESVTRQSAEEIGNGLKTIYQRFADIKAGGTAEDGVDYGQYAKALKSIGVDVLDAAGEFKGMDQILKETQEVWSGLSDTMKVAVGEKVAGKFQYNRFAALMNNPEYYQKALNATGSGSEGMMDQMNEYYMESIEGRLNTLQAAGEQVMSTLFNQDAVEPMIEDVTHLVNLLNDMAEKAGGLSGVMQALGAILLRTFSTQIAGSIANITNSLGMMAANSRNAGQFAATVNLVGLKNYSGSSIVGELASDVSGHYDQLSVETHEKLRDLSKQILEVEEQKNSLLNSQEKFLEDINVVMKEEIRLGTDRLEEIEKELFDLGQIEEAEGRLTTKQQKRRDKLFEEQKSLEKSLPIYNQINIACDKYIENLIKGVELTEKDVQELERLQSSAMDVNLHVERLNKLLELAKNNAKQIDIAKGLKSSVVETTKFEASVNNITKILSGFMSVSFGITMISDAINTLGDDSISTEEKIKTLIMNLTMGLTMLIPGVLELVKAVKALNLESLKFLATPIGAIILGIAAAVAAVVTIYTVWQESIHGATREFERQNEILSKTKKNYTDLEDEVESLKKSLDSVSEAQSSLDNFTKGTDEWREAVHKLNDEVLTLLQTYPELAEYVNNDNGVLTISQEGRDKLYSDKLAEASHLQNVNNVQQISTLDAQNKKYIEDFSNKWDISKEEINTALENKLTSLADQSDKVNMAFSELTKSIQTNNYAIEDFNNSIGKLTDYANYSTVDTNVTAEKKNTIKNQIAIDYGGRDLSRLVNDDAFIKSVSDATGKAIESATDISVFDDKIKFKLKDGSDIEYTSDELRDILADSKIAAEIEKEILDENISVYQKFGAEYDESSKQFVDANGNVITSLEDLANVTKEQAEIMSKFANNENYKNYMSTLYGDADKFTSMIAKGNYNKTELADQEAGLNAFLDKTAFESFAKSKELVRDSEMEPFREKYNGLETLEDFTKAVQDGVISLEGLSDAVKSLTPDMVDLKTNINGNEFTNRIDISADEENFDKFLEDQGMSKGAFNRMSRDAYEDSSGYYQQEKERLEELIAAKEKDGIVTDEEAEQITELNSEIEGLDDAAKDTTAMILNMSNGVVKLRNNIDDISEILTDEAAVGTTEWYEALDDLDSGLSQVLNIDAGTLSDEFLESGDALDYARRMAEGDMSAIDDLRNAASQDIIQHLTIQGEPGEDVEAIRAQLMAELQQLQSDINNGKITVTTDLDTNPFIQKLNEMLAAGQISAEQASNILSSVGMDAEIKHKTDKGFVDAISYHPRFTADAVEIGDGGPKIPGIEMVPEIQKVETDIDIPYLQGAHYTGSGVKTANTAASNPNYTGGYSGNPKKSGSGKSPKGSSGKSKNNQRKEKQKSEWDYLTNITNDLDRAAAVMEKLAKLEDRLYGANRVSQLKKLQSQYKNYIKLLQQEVKLAEKHANRLRTQAKDENGNLTISGYAYRAGISKLQFDGQGNLDNGREIEQALLGKLNQAISNYNKHRNDNSAPIYEEKVTQAQKDYDGFLKAMSEYESTLGKIEEGQSQIQEYKEKIQDAADEIVDAIQKGIEDTIKAIDSQRDFDKLYNDWMQGGPGYSHFNNQREYYNAGLKGFLSPDNSGISLFDTQLGNLANRIADVEDVFDINGKDNISEDDEKLSQQAAYDNLREATDNLTEMLNKMVEYYESLIDTIGEASKKMDELIDRRLDAFDQIEDYLDARLEQSQLLYGENPQIESRFYEQKINTNLEKLTSIQTAIEAKQATVKALESIEADNKELSSEELQELQDARDKITSLQEEQISTETDLLKDIANKLNSEVTAKMEVAINDLFGGQDVDWLSQQWELATRNSQQFYDDYNRAFELEKLQLKYQQLLNDTQNTSLATQQRISAQMNEQLGYLREKKNLSEYDVKYAEKQLEILQKQIALDEAKNNKSQMRLQRNAAGNYDFVYAADEDAVNKATESLLAAQQEAYNLSKQMFLDTYESAFKTAQEIKQLVIETATDASLSTEEQTERIKWLIDNLNEYMAGSAVELSEISVNLYNDIVGAEQLIAEENLGGLAETFDLMREHSEAIEAAVTEGLSNISNNVSDTETTAIETFDNIHGAFQGTLGSVEEDVAGTNTSIANALMQTQTNIIGDSGYLHKIRQGILTTGNGINQDIQTILNTIDGNFVIASNNSIESVSNIGATFSNVYTTITGEGGLLDQYRAKNNEVLTDAESDYTNFVDNALSVAESATQDLINTTNEFDEDLNTLNGTIKDCANQINFWREKIDNAMNSSAALIKKANDLEKSLGTVASRADRAEASLDGMGWAADYATDASYNAADACYAVADAAESAAQSASDAAAAYRDMAAAAAEAAGAGVSSSSSSGKWGVSDNNGAVAGKKGFSSYDAALKWARKSGIDNPYIYQYDSGGYTGTWSLNEGIDNKNGKLAILHQKELVLNAADTENMLSAVKLVREIMSGINTLPSLGKTLLQNNLNGDTIEQRVEINATFPGVTEAIEIKQALEQLADNAYQVANKYKY